MSAIVTQNAWAPAMRCSQFCSRMSSIDSMETSAPGGGLAALADIALPSRVDRAGDQPGHFFWTGGGDRFLRDLAAASHHRHPVANREHIGHAMADQDDRHARIAQAANEI